MGWAAHGRRDIARGLKALVALVTLAPSPALGFAYFEHKYLGDRACALVDAATEGGSAACTRAATVERVGKSWEWFGTRYWAPSPLNIGRSFGDLVGIAGDHSADWEGMAERWKTRVLDPTSDLALAVAHEDGEFLSWLSSSRLDALAERDSAAVREAVQAAQSAGLGAALRRLAEEASGEMEIHGADHHPTLDFWRGLRRARPRCWSPSKELEDRFSRLDDYVSLAQSNASHFGWEALFTYLEQQRQAVQEKDTVRAAFALHFLTDFYSAGHVRVDRRTPPAEAKHAHDWDSRNGLAVRQSFWVEDGERIDVYWMSYGDGCLLTAEARPTRLLALFTSVLSLVQVSGAAVRGTWSRPVGLPIDEINPPVQPEAVEHFNLVLGFGLGGPMDAPTPSTWDLARARISLEYYTPLWASFFLYSAIGAGPEVSEVTPLGVGLSHEGLFLVRSLGLAGRLGPILRWGGHDPARAGVLFEGSLTWELFPPLSLSLTGTVAPLFRRRHASVTQIEGFLGFTYRLERR